MHNSRLRTFDLCVLSGVVASGRDAGDGLEPVNMERNAMSESVLKCQWPSGWLPVVLLLIGTLVGGTGCASTSPSPTPERHVTVRKEASVMPGLTYAWLAMPRLLDAEKDARVEAPEFRARMQQALDKELASKGYRLASGGSNADFLMAWRAGVRDVDQVSLADSPDTATEVPQAGIACDGHGCSQLVMVGEAGAPEPRVQTYHHLEGGLLVEAVEPGSVRLLWSAYNRGTVHTGEGSQSGLDVIATETLERFPESNR